MDFRVGDPASRAEESFDSADRIVVLELSVAEITRVSCCGVAVRDAGTTGRKAGWLGLVERASLPASRLW